MASVSVYDGFISRHLNRRISRPLARLLTYTPVTPNQVSIISLGIALAAFLSFLYGQYIAGALLAQASSIVSSAWTQMPGTHPKLATRPEFS